MSTQKLKKTLEIIGMQWANELFTNALEWTDLVDFPNDEKISQEARAILMIGHAYLQQNERISILHREKIEYIAEVLEGKLDYIAGRLLPLDSLNSLLDIAESTDFLASQSGDAYPSLDHAVDYGNSLGITPNVGESIQHFWDRIKEKSAEIEGRD